MNLVGRGHIFWERIGKSILEVISLAIDKFMEGGRFSFERVPTQ